MSDAWPTAGIGKSETKIDSDKIVRQRDIDEASSIDVPQPDDLYLKEEKKRVRQQLKLQCLCLATNKELTSEQIVEAAKAFYDFVRT